MNSTESTPSETLQNEQIPEDLPEKNIYLPPEPAESPVIWKYAIMLIALHIFALHFVLVTGREAKLSTWVFCVTWAYLGGLGTTAGAHRLWAHNSYSAKLPLRILLALLYCTSGEYSLYRWIRDHRTHHKFTETAADPTDARRGFLFAHMGWFVSRRHPAVKYYTRKIDMSDINNDSVLRIVNKYYIPLMVILAFMVPTVIPVYFWNETWELSIRAGFFRYVLLLNLLGLGNSVAHMWGNHPYNKNMNASDSALLSLFVIGDGWHNYHHVFPWDYRTGEVIGHRVNLTSIFIEIMAWLGQAYNLKTASDELIEKTSQKKGDGTRNVRRLANHIHG